MGIQGYAAKIALLVGIVIGLWLWDWHPSGVLAGLAIGFVLALLVSKLQGAEDDDADR